MAELVKDDDELVAIDRYMRRMNFLPDSAFVREGIDAEVIELLQSYADGFNAYLTTHPPIAEFRLLGYRPQPWTIEDMLLINKVMGFLGLADAQGSMEKLLIQMIQHDIDDQRMRELFPYLWPDLKPHLKIDRRFNHCLNQAQKAITWFKLLYLEDEFETWIVYLLTIMARSPVTVMTNFCHRFQLAPRIENFIINEKTLADKTSRFLNRRTDLKASEIYTALKDLNIEGLLFLMAVARKEEVEKSVSMYVTTMRSQQPLLNGDDLKSLGYRPGPIFKTILETLLLARLDEQVSTRKEEIALVNQEFAPFQSN